MSKPKVTVKYSLHIYASRFTMGFGFLPPAWHLIIKARNSVDLVKQEFQQWKKDIEEFEWFKDIAKIEIRETRKVTSRNVVETIAV